MSSGPLIPGRRRVLQGLVAGTVAATTACDPAGPRSPVVNDVSRLNPIAVARQHRFRNQLWDKYLASSTPVVPTSP